MKRLFDIVAASAGIILVAPILLLAAILVKLSSPGPIFFRQQRVGRHFRPFWICKFRTMVPDAPAKGGPITFGDDPRITPVGRWLRKTKIDELPQLINVVAGDMSLVGPRPEVSKYVEEFRRDYEEILRVRPGITDLASIQYRDEATLLGQSPTPEEEYRRRVLPEKIRLAKQYAGRSSLLFDLQIIGQTIALLIGDCLGLDRRAPSATVSDGRGPLSPS